MVDKSITYDGKYRVCKNKYGWYKVQEWVLNDREITSLKLFFLWIWDCNHNILFKYGWYDTFDQDLYKTKEDALSEVDKLIQQDIERSEKKNNDWSCEGEI